MCSEVPDVFINKQWLINDPSNIVNDTLSGLLRCNPQLALLDCGNVVVQRDHLNLDKVKIISGGPSGHEPSFAGFVGKGMLTASVQGGIYSSPTPNLILKTIKELARRHDKGILVIIGNNNMSDTLSFGLAVERAKNIPNVKIRLIQVDDVCNKTYERRGLTATILIQKIAGAMAEADGFLFDIHVLCKTVMSNIATFTISLNPAISPHFEISSCVRPITKNIEFGAGMHGEKGFMEIPMTSAYETVEIILKYFTEDEVNRKINLNPDDHVVVLLNNLGKTSKLEEFIFINEIVTQIQNRQVIVERVYSGSYITSLEMHGFSITILNLVEPNILLYLDAPTDAPLWKVFGPVILSPETSLTISTEVPAKEMQRKPNKGPAVCEKSSKIIANVINFACGALISCEKQLNLIDSESGDADTGTNLRKPAHKINDYLTKGKLKIQWPFMLFEEISKILETSSEGLLSCFYAIMFEAGAQRLLNLTENSLTIVNWSQVLDSACIALKKYGKTDLGRNTMYDSLQAANVAFKKGISSEMGILDTVGLAAIAAEDAAKRTRLEGACHPDPGAHAVGIWMRAVFESLKLHKEHFE